MMHIKTEVTEDLKLKIEANENSFWAHVLIVKTLSEDMRDYVTNNATISKESAEVFNNVQDLCDAAERLYSLMEALPEHGGLPEDLYNLLTKPYETRVPDAKA